MRITIFVVAICGLLTSMTSIAVGYKVVNTNPTFDKLSYLDSDSEFVIPSVNPTDFEEKALILGDRLVFTAVDANGSRELYSYSNLDKNVKKTKCFLSLEKILLWGKTSYSTTKKLNTK